MSKIAKEVCVRIHFSSYVFLTWFEKKRKTKSITIAVFIILITGGENSVLYSFIWRIVTYSAGVSIASCENSYTHALIGRVLWRIWNGKSVQNYMIIFFAFSQCFSFSFLKNMKQCMFGLLALSAFVTDVSKLRLNSILLRHICYVVLVDKTYIEGTNLVNTCWFTLPLPITLPFNQIRDLSVLVRGYKKNQASEPGG